MPCREYRSAGALRLSDNQPRTFRECASGARPSREITELAGGRFRSALGIHFMQVVSGCRSASSCEGLSPPDSSADPASGPCVDPPQILGWKTVSGSVPQVRRSRHHRNPRFFDPAPSPPEGVNRDHLEGVIRTPAHHHRCEAGPVDHPVGVADADHRDPDDPCRRGPARIPAGRSPHPPACRRSAGRPRPPEVP